MLPIAILNLVFYIKARDLFLKLTISTGKMAIETERKFLVKGDFKHLASGKTSIRQYYLLADKEKTIRIRISDERAVLTIKSAVYKGSFSRSEWEFEIPLCEAMEIIKIGLPGMIDKTRYYIPAGPHTFEVDEFHGKNEGLIIAEIELSSESEEFERPEWLGEEVTGNPKYYNSNLI
jgi:adenylate cyclase